MDWFVTPPGKEKQLKVIKSYTEKTSRSNKYMPNTQVYSIQKLHVGHILQQGDVNVLNYTA